MLEKRVQAVTPNSLRIFEFDLVADFIVPNTVGVYFEREFCIRFGEVGRMPGFCDDLIHHGHFGVDPEDCKVERDKEHVDGGVETGIPLFDQKQSFVETKGFAKHQSAQATLKRIAISHMRWGFNFFVQVMDNDGAGHGIQDKTRRLSAALE